MNFLSIEYFAAVASEHSFSKAASGSSDARFSYAMCRSN